MPVSQAVGRGNCTQLRPMALIALHLPYIQLQTGRRGQKNVYSSGKRRSFCQSGNWQLCLAAVVSFEVIVTCYKLGCFQVSSSDIRRR